jgi:hypothetical protein
MVRKIKTFSPLAMAHIHGHGCRDLLVYCGSERCHHSASINGDHLPDDLPVRSLCGLDGLHAMWVYRRRCPARLGTARQ